MLSFLKLNSPLQWHENLQIARIENPTQDTTNNIASKLETKLGLNQPIATSSFVIFENNGNHLQQRFIINVLQWQIDDVNGLENYFTRLGFAVTHMTPQAYTNDYFPPAKDMGKLAKNLTYSAFVLFLLGLIGLFFDKLSTVNFGNIERNLLIFTAVTTPICLFSLRDKNSTKPQLAMVSFVMWVGNVIVAGLFSSMLAFFLFSLSLLASNYVATESMTFQFSEPTKATQKYDKWVSVERTDFQVLCQLNPNKTITRKTVQAYQFLGMTRIRTKDICQEIN